MNKVAAPSIKVEFPPEPPFALTVPAIPPLPIVTVYDCPGVTDNDTIFWYAPPPPPAPL